MSEFRVEKQRAEAEVTLSGGGFLRGTFFLAESSSNHLGPERVADLLNAERGFVPFQTNPEPADTILINPAHVVTVKLLERTNEARLDPGYELAAERHVAMLLSNGTALCGAVRVYRPDESNRLSDYLRSPEVFRYVETPDGTFVVNIAHIVDLRETLS
jgi:hypothetical protein